MNLLKITLVGLLLFAMSELSYAQEDWANLKRYKIENSKLEAPNKDDSRVVFMGNSITDGWPRKSPAFFVENPSYIGRGIGGQVTSQMVLRFRQDVIELEPSVVVILAGINDIAENKGPIALSAIYNNIVSMAELAKANNITTILCSVLPAAKIPWRETVTDAPEKVLELNSMLKKYAKSNNLLYVDYYKAMVDTNQGLSKELSKDGIHPKIEGYAIMEPLVKKAITKALK